LSENALVCALKFGDLRINTAGAAESFAAKTTPTDPILLFTGTEETRGPIRPSGATLERIEGSEIRLS
jgi:hypothetical protein